MYSQKHRSVDCTSSSSAAQSGAPRLPAPRRLPIIKCPYCGIYVTRRVSDTKSNPDRVFYRCENQQTKCPFWKWEEDYKEFLRGIGVMQESNADYELFENETLYSQLIGELKNEIGDMKNEVGDLKNEIRGLKTIKFLIATVVLLMIVMICNYQCRVVSG